MFQYDILRVFAIFFLPKFTSATIRVDFSQLQDFNLQEKADEYSVGALFDTHSTSAFKLKISPKTAREFDINLNQFTETPNNLETPVNRINFVESALRNVSRTLSPDGKAFLRHAVMGSSTPVTLSPNDAEFNELIRFLQAYRHFWNIIGKETVPRVENLEDASMTKASFDTLAALLRLDFEASNKAEAGKRRGRKLAPMAVSEDNLKHLLTTVFNVPRNSVADKENGEVARAYIRGKFESYGLFVAEHVFANYETDVMFGERLEGTNVIGILPGKNWKTGFDTPVVLGAHADTVVGSPGMDDNGSGMAALMETARMLSSLDCVFDNSIIFVAFDFEEIGTQGSMMFVKDLIPRLLQDQLLVRGIKAAIVLDCIANWDPKPHSQDIPDSWRILQPSFATNVEARNFTGDFLTLIYREGYDNIITKKFDTYFSRLHTPAFRLEHMSVDTLGHNMPTPASLKAHYDVLRSDHARFWYTLQNNTDEISAIPAVLVSDTGPFRGRLRECYHKACDVHIAGNEADVRFLAKTTEATAWTVADLADARCGPRANLMASQMFELVETLYQRKENGIREKTKERDFEKEMESVDVKSIAQAIEVLDFLGIIPTSKRKGRNEDAQIKDQFLSSNFKLETNSQSVRNKSKLNRT